MPRQISGASPFISIPNSINEKVKKDFNKPFLKIKNSNFTI